MKNLFGSDPIQTMDFDKQYSVTETHSLPSSHRLRDVIAVQTDDVVGDDASEEIFDERLEFGIHLLQLGDQIREEFGHVFLLSRVQRLLVHGVDFAKALRVVGFALGGGEEGEELLQLHEDLLVLRRLQQRVARENAAFGRRHHEQMLHAAGHVTGGAEIGQAHEVAARSGVFVRPIIPRVGSIVRILAMLLRQLFCENGEVGEGP